MGALISMTWPQYRRLECSYCGRAVRLSPLMADLVSALLLRRGQIVSHGDLIEAVWPDPDYSPDFERHALYMHIAFVRVRLPGIILHFYGRGYMIDLPVAERALEAA